MGGRAAEGEFVAWATAARPRLLRTATALAAGDRQLAEDVVQTTLVKVFLAWSRIGPGGDGDHPDRYAHHVLLRSFIDETRRGWWRQERGSRQPADGDHPVGASGFGEATVHGFSAGDLDDIRVVRDALAELPRDLRVAVLLRYWLGCDVAESAQILRCRESTLRVRAFRGLRRLRTILGDLGDVDEPGDVGGSGDPAVDSERDGVSHSRKGAAR
jgi:RNA polymerase sigma factor (sigma-70 family)